MALRDVEASNDIVEWAESLTAAESDNGSNKRDERKNVASKKNPNKIFVQPRSDGDWEAKRQGAKRASAVEPTKAAAKQRATDLAKKTPGGAEVVPKRRDGTIDNPNTINRKDPNPPKDKKH